MPNIELLNCDCMELMAQYTDKHFDLAICDPPYRDAKDNAPVPGMREKEGLKMEEWQDKPNEQYFKELFRVSKNQIIWGANNYIEHLYSTNCIIFWNKVQCLPNFSDGEMAWTSFNSVARIFEYVWSGNRYGKVGNIKGVGKPTIRIHPTEKPVALYEWLLRNYAKEGDLILDTHGGSFNSAKAAHNLGFDFVGCEIDTEYFEAAKKRFDIHSSQLFISL